MLINLVNLSYMGGPGLIPLPHLGVSRVEVLPVFGFVLSGDLSVGHHLTETLDYCSRSLYAVRIPKAHGLPTSSLHEVIRATDLARLLYVAPAWRGFATAQDYSRIDRFINRTVNCYMDSLLLSYFTQTAYPNYQTGCCTVLDDC